ncbi:Exosome complex exonuclease RRP4 [Cavenderia fasciculata]|uniref:Exosome complex exonuclease RRP4 n=1 Tax=Cavenderia fasciculata TaxID=261658 RepID=F4PK30_CACFS|nr:Exosome complex exonuclease RRP4 [Cavenderia fasciculata]EGG23954.1 Exosome complex exonuclease RRP4 [Cavenderia fasciculata]|eukprot:XP_004361805.1 Exosome complex exonuclease RRP4 [Cavenderia fasciculata]
MTEKTTMTTQYLSEININIYTPSKRLGLMHHRSNCNINAGTSMQDVDVYSNKSNAKEEEMYDDENDPKTQFARNLVTPGTTISKEGEYLKGHGTFHHQGSLIASVSGVVDKVDKLVSVRAFHSRYQGEIGDIIVGRITQVAAKRWKVDCNARQDYILMLTAINLPGGIQRRRTSSDELQMRNFFVENDLIYAEVQAINGDGSVALHTRNQRYGKLMNGVLVSVPPALIKRSKQHAHTLDCGVDIILGVNGYIWIADSAQQQAQTQLIQRHEKDSYDQPLFVPPQVKQVSRESRQKIARVRNAIHILHTHYMLIHTRSIMEIYNMTLNMPLTDMLTPNKARQIITAVHTNIQERMGFKDDNEENDTDMISQFNHDTEMND